MQTKVHLFTSAAVNYLPKVRILFRSLRQHHPDWVLHLLLADELIDAIDINNEPFDEITPLADLGIDDWQGWAFCHSITELATAMKPWMLERLLPLSGEAGKVIYMDPDTVVFSPLTDILDALDHASIVLTPHQTRPEASLDAVIDNEICSLKHGIYNLGFIAVRNSPIGRAFARWWADRTYFFCRNDIPNGLFTDQRWIDLVPALFPDVAIMRSSRHNVATWNVTTRQLSLSPEGSYMVDGEPLGFYHFTGFDSGAHRIMAAKHANNNPALTALINWYSDQIKPLANDPLSTHRWAFSCFQSGAKISEEQRLVYRSRNDLQRKFANPFALDGYEKWWKNRAKSEYPSLFDRDQKAKGLEALKTPITPGFLGQQQGQGVRVTAGELLRQAFQDPKTGLQLGRRAWEVLRSEGIGGIKSRALF